MAAGFDPVRELLAQFRSMENQLVELVRLGGQGADIVALRARLERLRASIRVLGQQSDAWASARIGQQWSASAAAAQRTLIAAGLARQRDILRFEVRAAQRLITAVAGRLRFMRQALLQGLVDADPKTITDILVEGLRRDGALVAIEGGELKVLTPGGELWDPRAYARMAARTGIADARREAFRYRYLGNGVDVVEVVANGTTHDVCEVWEGELLSLTGITPGLPTVDDARAEGLFHPNCTHRYVVAIGVEQPGVDETAPLALEELAPDDSFLGLSPEDPRTPPPNLR
jgi:hypothetical protein